MVTLGIVYL